MSTIGPIGLLEDDEDDPFLIKMAIKGLGVANQLICFPNGRLALDYLETTPLQPFLILCDINMPLMNGLELRALIHKSDYLRQKAIPFVFLTTTANPGSIRKAYDASVQGFYQKAADQPALARQLKLIIDYWASCLHPNNKPRYSL
ncbi:response regulator [Fibrella forsythiae]|uniref:Response regulator n=1 Tax=Fibrella forsythiae TaxID=2817061 RepID=A0ABS3JUT2_9BACT|nr:response regulator [Fibrella forsythiae]MBO0953218.1 response regulator [Fibrella forsythiae]